MSGGLRVLVGASILLASVALATAVIWWADARQVQIHYVLGVGFIVLGVAFTIVHWTLGDEFLSQHASRPGAAEMRRTLRSGWVGILLGSAMLGVLYFDRWFRTTAAQAQFKVAFNRGMSAAKDRDWQTAADAFSEAIQFEPNNAKAHRNRGTAYLFQGSHDRAIMDLSEAIRLDPDDANSRYYRGVAYSQKEDHDSALIDFAEAIRLKPNYAKAYQARSRIYVKKGDDVQAKADQQRAAEIDAGSEESSSKNQ